MTSTTLADACQSYLLVSYQRHKLELRGSVDGGGGGGGVMVEEEQKRNKFGGLE